MLRVKRDVVKNAMHCVSTARRACAAWVCEHALRPPRIAKHWRFPKLPAFGDLKYNGWLFKKEGL